MGDLDPSAAKRTALVIDDDYSVRRVTARMLASLGFEVLVATDGAEGLAVFEAHGPSLHVILLDYHMPRMNGHECFNGLRERGAACPVILCSGYCSDVPDELISAVDGVIEKPFRLDILRNALSGLIGA